MQRIALHFYLGLKNEPWFGPASSENSCIERHNSAFLHPVAFLINLVMCVSGNQTYTVGKRNKIVLAQNFWVPFNMFCWKD